MFKLVQTCGGCPEAYNVFLNGEYAGFMHLRHGYFYVETKDGATVYSANPNGDGIFEWDERDFHLNNGCKALKAKLEERPVVDKLIFEIVSEEFL